MMTGMKLSNQLKKSISCVKNTRRPFFVFVSLSVKMNMVSHIGNDFSKETKALAIVHAI